MFFYLSNNFSGNLRILQARNLVTCLITKCAIELKDLFELDHEVFNFN